MNDYECSAIIIAFCFEKHLTEVLKIMSSKKVISNCPSQDYTHLDDHKLGQ